MTCWPVITEAVWLLRSHPRALQRLLASVESGSFELLPLEAPDALAISAILTRYQDLEIQLADAAIIHLANREGIDTIFTLDRRDFGIMPLAHGNAVRPNLGHLAGARDSHKKALAKRDAGGVPKNVETPTAFAPLGFVC